jgi:hypothetical protein
MTSTGMMPNLLASIENEAIAKKQLRALRINQVPAGFQIEEYPLNKDHWTEGFVSVEEAHEPFKTDPNL